MESEKLLTIEELSRNDGLEGRSAYIAIGDIVYDVSEINLLRSGKHHGVIPGKDVTELFVHDIKIMKRAKIVGKLIR